jgi:hypothetical protein
LWTAHSVAIFDHPALLLEFDTDTSKNSFVNLCAKNPFLLSEISPRAQIRPHTFPVIFWFILCQGQFNPSYEGHLHSVKRENSLEAGSIIAASWCKCPNKRSPNQATASLKVACLNSETANCLLSGHILVEDHLVNVHKDLFIPIICIKCQEYGHMQDICINAEKCANCASEFHSTANCSRAPKCTSCSDDSSHLSSSPTFPVFLHKSEALVECYPENAMPYHPTKENWTRSTSPPNPLTMVASLPAHKQTCSHQQQSSGQASQAQNNTSRSLAPPLSQPWSCQTDNGWPKEQ